MNIDSAESSYSEVGHWEDDDEEEELECALFEDGYAKESIPPYNARFDLER